MKNYLEAYRIWSSGDESPEIYHTWAGLSTISSYISRQVWIDQGRDRTFLNLYVLFVGPAGNGKSTAMSTARKLVTNFKKERPAGPESGTWQSLVKDLSDKELHRRKYQYQDKKTFFTHCSLFCDEFGSLLKNDPQGWVQFLTRIYGCDDFDHKVKTAAEGESRYDLVENPYLVFLGCMTPDLTKEAVTEGIISTGFNRRCVFVVSGFSGKCVPMRTLTDAQMQARDYCLKWAKDLLTVKGPFTFGPNTMEAYEDWYMSNRQRMKNESVPFMASWLNSKDQIILRTAMLYELAISKERLLSVESFLKAVELVDATEKNFHRIFSLSGRNPVADIANKIRTAMEIVEVPQNLVSTWLALKYCLGDCEEKQVQNLKKIMHQFRPDGSTQEIQEAIKQLVDDKVLEKYEQAGPPRMVLLGTPAQLARLQEKENLIDEQESQQHRSSNRFGFESGPQEQHD